MSSLQKLKNQIENANALGRGNLEKKGVYTTGKETTYQLMQMIENIVGEVVEDPNGEVIQYVDIVYNEDDSITLIDAEGKEHIMTGILDDDGKLMSVTYDGVKISMRYNDKDIVKIGTTIVDLKAAPVIGFQIQTEYLEKIEALQTKILGGEGV